MKAPGLITLMALTLVAAGATLAEETAGVPRAKPLKLEHNAGKLESGPKYDYTFPIRNEGTAPLEIRRAEADCMCVTPSFDRVIEPGQTGSVRIQFNTRGRAGVMLKHVTVETNDPDQPKFLLTLSALLQLPIEVSPGREIMLPLAPGDATTLEITLHATQGKTLKLGPVRNSYPQIRVRPLSPAEIAERISEDPARTRMLLVTVPKTLSGQAFDATLTVPTNSPKTPVVAITVHSYPQTAVSASPPRLYFGDVRTEASPPLFKIITLGRRQGAFKVLGTESSDKILRLQVSQERPDSWEIVAIYEGGWTKGTHEGVITIRTDDPHRPIVRIPYRAEVS